MYIQNPQRAWHILGVLSFSLWPDRPNSSWAGSWVASVGFPVQVLSRACDLGPRGCSDRLFAPLLQALVPVFPLPVPPQLQAPSSTLTCPCLPFLRKTDMVCLPISFRTCHLLKHTVRTPTSTPVAVGGPPPHAGRICLGPRGLPGEAC